MYTMGNLSSWKQNIPRMSEVKDSSARTSSAKVQSKRAVRLMIEKTQNQKRGKETCTTDVEGSLHIQFNVTGRPNCLTEFQSGSA